LNGGRQNLQQAVESHLIPERPADPDRDFGHPDHIGDGALKPLRRCDQR
jgi:hypothetical protein